MKTNKENKEFRTVEFMRSVRDNLNKKYGSNRPEYLKTVQEAMERFKKNKKAYTQHTL